jgi:hypothetical protein
VEGCEEGVLCGVECRKSSFCVEIRNCVFGVGILGEGAVSGILLVGWGGLYGLSEGLDRRAGVREERGDVL